MLGVGLSNILPQQRLLVWFCVTFLLFTQKLIKIITQLLHQVTASSPEEQHDGKRLVERRRELHTQLDGLLQVLLGNVEAVVVDLAAQEDVLMHGALLQNVTRTQ